MIRNQKTKGTFTCGPLFFKGMFVFQSWLDWLDWLDFNLQYIQGLLQRIGSTSDAIINKDSFGTFFKQFPTKEFFFYFSAKRILFFQCHIFNKVYIVQKPDEVVT